MSSEQPEVNTQPEAQAEVAPVEVNQAAPEGKKKKEKKEKKEKAEEKAAPVVPARESVMASSYETDSFGDLPLIQSKFKSERNWTEVSTLNASLDSQDVWIRARVHTVRAKGKMAFLIVRRGFYTAQAFLHADDTSKEMVKYASKIPNESIVDIFGSVRKVDQPIKSATQQDVELVVKKLFVVSASHNVLPFQMEDACRPVNKNEEKKEDAAAPTVSLDHRLDNRALDIRTPANHAIFKLQSRIGQYFRQYFIDRDFVEIHSPKIIPGVSEGGSEVFKIDYFGINACLAQSPQLYKQMGVNADLFRVFEIGPVFRAEKSFTHRHVCEFVGLDFEMEIKEHYTEITEMLGKCFIYIFDQLNLNCSKELAAVKAQFNFEDLQYTKEPLVIHFWDAIKLLRENGDPNAQDFEDLSTPQEKLLGKLVKEKYGTDFYIIDKYPLAARPFYTMPCPEDPRYTNSYDVFLRGNEITSGAQRVHDLELLKKRANECGIPESNLASYLESFRYGAYPHGGAGIGLERVVFLFLDLEDIKQTSMFPRTPNRCYP